jgi:hypothetical protein
MRGTYWDDHASTLAQLFNQRRGNLWSRGGNNNYIKGCSIRKAVAAVTH